MQLISAKSKPCSSGSAICDFLLRIWFIRRVVCSFAWYDLSRSWFSEKSSPESIECLLKKKQLIAFICSDSWALYTARLVRICQLFKFSSSIESPLFHSLRVSNDELLPTFTCSINQSSYIRCLNNFWSCALTFSPTPSKTNLCNRYPQHDLILYNTSTTVYQQSLTHHASQDRARCLRSDGGPHHKFARRSSEQHHYWSRESCTIPSEASVSNPATNKKKVKKSS